MSIKQTYMDKEILKNILKLDSIYQVLDWKDRIIIHLLLQNKIDTPSQNIEKMYEWMIVCLWIPPKVEYGQDRLLYIKHESGEKISAEEYRKRIKLKDLPI